METQDDHAFADTLADVDGEHSGMVTTLASADAMVTLPAQAQNSTNISVLPQIALRDGQLAFVSDAKPRFREEGRLGAGGIGEVVRAWDIDIGRSVAIKRLHPQNAHAASIARFIEEMRVTGALDHPNVVPVHDVGVDERGDFYFVMRHVEGETLETIIERLAADDPDYHRRFRIERRVEIFKAILEALAFAHSKGVIHRDIKPANIMVGPFGEVMVMDWGVARRARDNDLARTGDATPPSEDESLDRAFTTQAGALVGTPAYMAPEQVRGIDIDERSDTYALTALLYELLYLKHYLPEAKSLVELCNGVVNYAIPFSVDANSKLQPTVPAELYWFIEKGLRKDPAERFQAVHEMLERLERRAEGEIDVQCPVTFSKSMLGKAEKALDKHSIVPVAGGMVLLAAVLFLAAVGLHALLS